VPEALAILDEGPDHGLEPYFARRLVADSPDDANVALT
jgi:hypothetical protein